MKKYVAVLQFTGMKFKVVKVSGRTRDEAIERMREEGGVSVSFREWSKHNEYCAKMDVKHYNGLSK